MKQQLQATLNKLQTISGVDQTMVEMGLLQLDSTDKYTRDTNPDEHFNVFVVPIVPSKRLIYMGHHVKADAWMPPGGHIDEGETPMKALKREFEEELGFKITFEVTELFDFTIAKVQNERTPCKRHFDFWYLVHMAAPEEFLFDTREFHDAGWMSYEEAVEKGIDDIKHVLSRLRDR